MSNFRSDFHAELAQLVLDDIQYQRAKYYYFLGRVDKWDAIDETPPVPEDNQHENTVIRSNMIFAKRIAPSDISITARRYDWELGNVYDQWDHTDDMRTKRFFVLTDEFRVYKCLDNANGAESSVQPTGTSIAPVRLEDGYLWKYMYTIPTFKRSRFVTANNMPVQRALTDNFFNRGELEQVVVTNKGSGYTNTSQTTIVVNDTGKTVGSGATGTLVRGVIGNITGVNIVSGGTGYTKGVKIDITTSTGSGAVLTPVITGGVVTGVTVVEGGIGYAAGDTITFRVGGAVIIPKLNASGTLTGVIIRDPGIGYNLPPTLTLSGALGAGIGKFGNPTAIINAIIFNGSVQLVSIVDPGITYPVGTSVVVTIQGDGANAAATPVVYNGEIVDIILDNPGSGYSFTIINVDEPGNASFVPATVVGLIDQSDYESDQSIIEQTAVPGAIYSIGIADSGNGYSQNTTITIEGDGTGATATCEVLNGEIVRTQVTNFGSGYSYANVIINDPATTPGAGAELYAILPPVGGHGTNAPVELYGDTLILNSQLRNEIVATAIDQDFRQFGILKNPRDAFSFANFTEEASLILYKTVFTDVTGLIKDEVLIQGGNRFVVADIDGTTVYLLKLNQTGTLTTGELLTESDPTRDYDCSLIVSTPNFNKYSGSLLYISNEAPFTFTPEQGIIIKTLIQF
jgi:hypothetical protein